MFKKSNTKVMILAIAVGVVIGVSLLVPSLLSTPEKTLNRYAKALEKGDWKGINKLLAPESRLLFEGVSLFMDDFLDEDLSKNVKAEIVVDSIKYGSDKNTAEVSCYIITEDKENNEINKDYETISMIKLDGKWYIDEGF